MKKDYKFYQNRKTRNHPSLQVSADEKIWKNLELTSSPTKTNRYIELKQNPNPNRKSNAFIRTYVRKYPIKTRGHLLERYHLSEEDLQEIEKFLLSRKNKKKLAVNLLNLGLIWHKPAHTNTVIKTNLSLIYNKKM